MSIREILKDGEPALSKVCHPVTQFDQKLWDLRLVHIWKLILTTREQHRNQYE